MSRKFLSLINLTNLPSDPASGSEGDIYWDSVTNKIRIYDGSAWNDLTSGGGGSSNSFATISVSGQSNVVADSSTDTLTLVAGSNVSLTTNATTDSITISSTDTNTTYGISAESATGGANLRLTDSSSTTDDVKIAAGTNMTVTRTDANTITLDSTGDYTSVDSITYPDYITFDTTPETTPTAPGSIYWDSGDGLPATILNSNVSIGIGQEQVALVKNATGSSIAKGSVVYINGAQGQRPTIALADADTEATSSKTFGMTSETIADGAEGFVTTFGVLRGVNTNGLTEGAPLWLSSTSGGYSVTPPSEPAHLVFVGYVVKAHASAGEIFINPQNGYELTELHGVLIDGTPADDEILAYDTTSGLWINQTASEANLATASHNHDSVYQPLDSDLTAIAALTGNGFIKKTAGTWGMDTSTYLTSYTETDPIYTASSWYSTINNSSNWNAAFGWGDHSSAGYALLSGATFSGDVSVTGNFTVNGTTTTINSTTISVDDKNIELGSVTSPTNTTADGGGITLKGATDKTFNWVNSTSSWTSSENIDLASGKVLKIAGTEVLSATQYTGNSATVTNGVYTSGSYSNPSWITGLAWSKISSTPTNLSGYGITDAQPLDADLTAIAGLSGTSGFLKKTAADTWTLDTNSYAQLDSPSFITKVTTPSIDLGTIGNISAQNVSITSIGDTVIFSDTTSYRTCDYKIQLIEQNVGTYPIVQGTATTSVSVATRSPVINLPSGIVKDELLLLFIETSANAPSFSLSGSMNSWVQVAQNAYITVLARIASSNSSTTIATSNLVSTNSTFSIVAYRISNHNTTVSAIDISGITNLTTLDPSSVTMTSSYTDNLFIAATGFVSTGSVTAQPTGYSSLISTSESTSNTHIYTAYLQKQATSENPSAFTPSGTITNPRTLVIGINGRYSNNYRSSQIYAINDGSTVVNFNEYSILEPSASNIPVTINVTSSSGLMSVVATATDAAVYRPITVKVIRTGMV